MRNIFLALVLANLAFAAWHTWFAESPRTIRPAPADVPDITLVSELPEHAADVRAGIPASDQAAAVDAVADGGEASEAGESAGVQAAADPGAPVPAEETAAAASDAVAASRCISVGPFRELAQAATATANLRAAGYLPTQRVAEGDVWIGYWVYIQAIPTEAEANEILARIRATGVKDAYVIPNSDSGNLVSLGVFSEISGVTRRRDEMRSLGYEPTVIDRTRRATLYWVDVILQPNQTLDFEALQTPGRIIRLEQRACEAAPA
ncbi:MAG TPA: SPOR domain-containing protein [Gammaproteobacteria bacterium]|nr:SPOR domain-containing protein [Gammaproteobacteria bacterium]